MSSTAPERDSLNTMLHVLDNQYVPYDVYRRMHGAGLSDLHKNSDLHEYYMKSIDAEFKKALLFSETVFVNRAYFINTPLLRKYILDDAQQGAFLELLHDGIIRPVLLNEDTFIASLEQSAFSTPLQKDRILDVYKKKLRNIHEFRHSGMVPGIQPGEIIPSRFKEALSDCLRDEAAMTQCCAALRRNVPEVDGEKLREKIRAVAEWAGKSPVREVTRESVYAAKICTRASIVADGRYEINPEVFALKLWVDALYNDNTAKLYGLKITMPENVPTSRELGVVWKSNAVADAPPDMKTEFDEKLSHGNPETIARILQHLDQNDTPLQLSYQNLTLQDILRIRRTPGWKEFIDDLKSYVKFSLHENDFVESLCRFLSTAKEYTGENRIGRSRAYSPAAVTVVSVAGACSVILLNVLGYDTVLGVDGDAIRAGIDVLGAACSLLAIPSVSKRVTRGIAFVNNKSRQIHIENSFGIDYSARDLSESELERLRESLREIREKGCGKFNPVECTSVE